MNSWTEIKETFVRGKVPNSLGYKMAVMDAARLFMKLLPYLKDEEQAKAAMNADADVFEGLCIVKETDALRAAGVLP